VTGALLHDIGKLEAYTSEGPAFDLTDAGKLQGEIPLGYYRIRRAIEDLPGFPPETAEAVLHIILSHHGSLEHGSPVVPCTREATLVHMIDNLGGRLGSFDRLEKELAPGASWSGFDRALGSGAYFGAAAAEDEQQQAA
jgi:3'-5' exoribonuclease